MNLQKDTLKAKIVAFHHEHGKWSRPEYVIYPAKRDDVDFCPFLSSPYAVSFYEVWDREIFVSYLEFWEIDRFKRDSKNL